HDRVIVIGGAARWKFQPVASDRAKGDGPVWGLSSALPAHLTAGSARRGARHGVQFLIAEVARHDRDRDGKIAPGLADAGNQRPPSLLSGPRRAHPDGHVFL